MKQLCFIACVLLPICFLPGCGISSESSNDRPTLEFKSDLEIQSEKTQISANIVRTAENAQLELVMPESLKGLKISHSESKNVITKNELAYKTDNLILPDSSDITAVFEVLDYIAKNQDESPFYKDNEEMAFIGKTRAGKFELRAARKTGLITEIKLGDKTTIKFSNQKKM